MRNSKKLHPVANLAKLNERNAAKQHGSVLRELQKQENQLNELINYRNQYLAAFKTAGESGLSAIQMQDYRIFIQRLDDAIGQQQQNVDNGRQDTQSSQTKWMDTRNQSKMINKVVENRQQLENQQVEKREQRELEDRPHKG
ncbi:MAG: flagellar export protein FliJ [Gammaproteobacteria bacterium]